MPLHHETSVRQPADYATEFDRSGRGFPNFGYRLRRLEKRLRAVETALAAQSKDTDQRHRAEYANVKENNCAEGQNRR